MRAATEGESLAGVGAQRAEEIIEALRRKHECKSTGSKKLPARSTVGIVLEGVMVNIVVPGSPAFNQVCPFPIIPFSTISPLPIPIHSNFLPSALFLVAFGLH